MPRRPSRPRYVSAVGIVARADMLAVHKVHKAWQEGPGFRRLDGYVHRWRFVLLFWSFCR